MAETKLAVRRAASAVAMLATLVLGLSAGAMTAEGALLVPYWRALPPLEFLAWYRDNAARLFVFFAPLETGAALLAVLAVTFARLAQRPDKRMLLASAVLAAAVLAGFPLYFERVNAAFAAGTIDADRVAPELARWAVRHWARTAIGIAAFLCALLGTRKEDP